MAKSYWIGLGTVFIYTSLAMVIGGKAAALLLRSSEEEELAPEHCVEAMALG